MTWRSNFRGGLQRADRVRLSWSDALVNTTAGLRHVALFGFLESTVLPAPLEAITVPLMLHRPDRAYRVALALWCGLMIGAVIFYMLGRALYEPVVEPVLGALGMQQDFDLLADKLSGSSLFWTIFLISIAPAPMQLATLGAGFLRADPATFVAAVALSRAIRYFGAAWLCRVAGTRLGLLRRGTILPVAALAATLAAIWLIYRLLT